MKRFISMLAAASAAAAGVVVALAGGAAGATGGLPRITLAMDGKSVTVGGQMVSGAVNIQTTVTKESVGEPTLARLDAGVTAAQAFGVTTAIRTRSPALP